MNVELDPPVYFWMSWYVKAHDTENVYLHEDGNIHEGVTIVDKNSNCLSTGWFNSEQDAWKARSAYYRKVNIPDTLSNVTKTLDDINTSKPLFDD